MDYSQNFYRILLITDSQLTAEAKYVLLQVVRLFGKEVVNEPVKHLADLMGVTDKVFKQARELLCELGYFISVSHTSKSERLHPAGRPNIAFKISSKVTNKLEQMEKDEQEPWDSFFVHRSRIDRLLCAVSKSDSVPIFMNKTKKIPLRQSGIMSVSNRLLLAILYLHADECGAVRRLGLSKLRRLAGMLESRLDSQLTKLAELGFLLCREPGVAGQHLFGRSSGAIFLNVFDDSLGDGTDFATLILVRANILDDYTKRHWGWRIYQAASHDGYRLLFRRQVDELASETNTAVNTDFLKVRLSAIRQKFCNAGVLDILKVESEPERRIPLDFTRTGSIEDTVRWAEKFHCFDLQQLFKDNREVFARFLLLKLHEFAAMLLTQYWDDLAPDHITLQKSLLGYIGAEIYPERLWKKSADPIRAGLIADALGVFIYRISFEIALQAKHIVKTAFARERDILRLLDKASYALVPVQDGTTHSNHWSIAVKLNNRSIAGRYITMDVRLGNISPEIKTYDADSSREVYERLQKLGYSFKARKHDGPI